MKLITGQTDSGKTIKAMGIVAEEFSKGKSVLMITSDAPQEYIKSRISVDAESQGELEFIYSEDSLDSSVISESLTSGKFKVVVVDSHFAIGVNDDTFNYLDSVCPSDVDLYVVAQTNKGYFDGVEVVEYV